MQGLKVLALGTTPQYTPSPTLNPQPRPATLRQLKVPGRILNAALVVGGEGGGRRRQVILVQANRGCRLDSPTSSPRHSYWRTQNSTGASGEQRQGRTRPRPLPAAAARPPIAHVWPRAGREPSASLPRPRTVPALLSLSQLLPRVWWLSCPAWLCDGLARWHLSGGDHPEFRREAVQQSAGARTGSGILRDQEAARSSGRSLTGVWVWPFRGRGRREVGRGQDRGVCRGAECGLPRVGRGHGKAGSSGGLLGEGCQVGPALLRGEQA